jgi:hypothetical protein
MPTSIVSPYPYQVGLTPEEEVYVNHIYMINESIHQGIIGGIDSAEEHCLYKAFRTARAALQEFRRELKREPLPYWFRFVNIVAGALAWLGFWQLMRWFGIW